MEGPGDNSAVRFELFGQFRIYVGDWEIATKHAGFYTYLKLLLLSGQTYFDITSAASNLLSPGAIRDTVDRGNGPPGDTPGGKFDFTEDTGASLRYREGLGLTLEGADCRSDIDEFEEVWGRRSTASKGRPKASDEELAKALDLYGEGVETQSWKKDPIFLACSKWIEKRLADLKEHRDDIQAELDLRLESSELARDGSIESELGERPEGWSEERGVHHVISGLASPVAEAESDEDSSPVLGDPLCQDEAASQQVQEAMIDVTEEGDAGNPQSEAQGESTTPSSGDSVKSPSEAKSEIDKSSPTASRRVAEPPRRRNVTALGVLVSAVVVVLIFAVGYMIGGGPSVPAQGDDRRSPQSNPVTKPDLDMSGGVTLPKDDPAEEQPIVRAPENPVSLNKLFLRNIGGGSVRYDEEDIVVARQLFPDYVYAINTNDNAASAAYKLNGEFRTMTCIVGVNDDFERHFTSKSGQVLFEGDGKILKQFEVQPGQAVPVSLDVTDIKVLIISFSYPVVIASPKAHR